MGDVATGKPLWALQHRDSVVIAAFSPDGTRIATASADHTRVWSMATGKPIAPPLHHHDAVLDIAFSPDGSRVVTASDDSTARLWELPLAAGTLADWEAVAARSPYALVNGVPILQLRAIDVVPP